MNATLKTELNGDYFGKLGGLPDYQRILHICRLKKANFMFLVKSIHPTIKL